AGLRPAQRRDQRHGQDQQRQQRAQACDQQLAAGAEREHDLVGPREQPRHQVLQALYRCEHGRPLGGAAYRAGMGASSERRPALQARAARSAVGRGYVPDALFPRTTRSAIVGLRPDTLVAPRRTIAVGRGYAPDVLFAATYGWVLSTCHSAEIRIKSFRAVTARATFLCLCKETWRKESTPRLRARCVAPGSRSRRA